MWGVARDFVAGLRFVAESPRSQGGFWKCYGNNFGFFVGAFCLDVRTLTFCQLMGFPNKPTKSSVTFSRAESNQVFIEPAKGLDPFAPGGRATHKN